MYRQPKNPLFFAIILLIFINLITLISFHVRLSGTRNTLQTQISNLQDETSNMRTTIQHQTDVFEASTSLFSFSDVSFKLADDRIVANINATAKTLTQDEHIYIRLITDQGEFEKALDENGNAVIILPICAQITPLFEIRSQTHTLSERLAPRYTDEIFSLKSQLTWTDSDKKDPKTLSMTITPSLNDLTLTSEKVEKGYFLRVPLNFDSEDHVLLSQDDLEDWMSKGVTIDAKLKVTDSGLVFNAPKVTEDIGKDTPQYAYIFILKTNSDRYYYSALSHPAIYNQEESTPRVKGDETRLIPVIQ